MPWTAANPPPPRTGRRTSISSNRRLGFASSSNPAPTGQTPTDPSKAGLEGPAFFPSLLRKGTVGLEKIKSSENHLDRFCGPVPGDGPLDRLRGSAGYGPGGVAADLGLRGD